VLKNDFHTNHNIQYFQLRYSFLVARAAEFMRHATVFVPRLHSMRGVVSVTSLPVDTNDSKVKQLQHKQ